MIKNTLPWTMDLFQYLGLIRTAKLGVYEKALLYFFASAFNWEKRLPSWYSARKICAYTSMSLNQHRNKRKRLEELGWIAVNHRGLDTAEVYVQIGRDDPEYESFHWAAWHQDQRSNEHLPLDDYFRYVISEGGIPPTEIHLDAMELPSDGEQGTEV